MAAVVGFVFKHWSWLAIAGLVLALTVSNGRLSHAKHDLSAARAALHDPASGKTWQAEAVARAADLGNCRAGLTTLGATIERQNASLTAQKTEDDNTAARTAAALTRERGVTAGLRSRIGQLAAERAKAGETPARACGRILLDGVSDE